MFDESTSTLVQSNPSARSQAEPSAAGIDVRSNESAFYFRRPRSGDGAVMHRMAVDSRTLDVNSSYAYMLWCRDFAGTSIMATVDGHDAGFITGFVRQDEPETLMVWQVAVDGQYRGRRLSVKMLDALVDRTEANTLETTISDDNAASIRLFTGLARRRGATLRKSPLFREGDFPEDGHETEHLYRIGPLNH